MSVKEKTKKDKGQSLSKSDYHEIILYNDDINTFDHLGPNEINARKIYEINNKLTSLVLALNNYRNHLLGGSQTTVTDGGNIPQNDLGLPVLTGNWKLKLWVETESGNIGYGETTASVVQKGQLITASGKDGNGNFTITGNIGQDGQVGIAFWKQYDVKDGRWLREVDDDFKIVEVI